MKVFGGTVCLLLLLGICCSRGHAQQFVSEASSDDREVVGFYEAVSSLTLRRTSSVDRVPRLDVSRRLANDTSSTNITNSSNATFKPAIVQQLEAVVMALMSPVILFVGQDVADLLQLFNGFVVGGVAGLVVKLQTLEKFDPLVIVDMFSTLIVAGNVAFAGLQNPGVGVRLQGGVILKMLSSNVVESLYFGMMRDLGGCAMISEKKSTQFPRGMPLNCTKSVKLGEIEVHGEEVAQWIITGIEYGLAAVGAAVAPAIALLIVIFNAASMGANMCVTGFFQLFAIIGMWAGMNQDELDDLHLNLMSMSEVIFWVLLVLSFLLQLKSRLSRKKGAGQGPYKYWRFRVLEVRGDDKAPKPAEKISLSDLRLQFHNVPEDLPEASATPPEEGTDWAFTFQEPISLTSFAFMTAGKDSDVTEDPVSWVLEASAAEEPSDDDWLCLNKESNFATPLARNARSVWFELKLASSSAAAGEGEQKQTCCAKIKNFFAKIKAFGKSLIAPFMVSSHIVKEVTDPTAGKDKKSYKALAIDALVQLGWEETVYRKQLEITLRMLLKSSSPPIKPDVLQSIVKAADDEELKILAADAANQNLSGFVKNLLDVLRKLAENVPDLADVIKKVTETLNLGLVNHYATLASQVVAKEFYKTRLRARMMLLTLETISVNGTSVEGKIQELLDAREGGKETADDESAEQKKADDAGAEDDPQKTTEQPTEKLIEFLEQLASGTPYPGRSGEVQRMEAWLVENMDSYKAEFVAKFGKIGKLLLCLDKIVALYPKFKQCKALMQHGLADKVKAMLERSVKARVQPAPETGKDSEAAGKAEKVMAKDESHGAAPPKQHHSVRDGEAYPRPRKILVAIGSHAAATPPSDAPQDSSSSSPALRVAEQKALQEACERELSSKLGMTLEQARRLTSYMSPAERAEIGSTGNINLAKVKRLAGKHAVEINDAKVQERQGALHKFRMEKELVKAAPPYERRSAAKKASSMSSAAILAYMNTPRNQCTEFPPDMNLLVCELQSKVAELQAELDRLRAGASSKEEFGGPPPDEFGGPPPDEFGGPPPDEFGGPPPDEFGGPPPDEFGGPPPDEFGGPPPDEFGGPSQAMRPTDLPHALSSEEQLPDGPVAGMADEFGGPPPPEMQPTDGPQAVSAEGQLPDGPVAGMPDEFGGPPPEMQPTDGPQAVSAEGQLPDSPEPDEFEGLMKEIQPTPEPPESASELKLIQFAGEWMHNDGNKITIEVDADADTIKITHPKGGVTTQKGSEFINGKDVNYKGKFPGTPDEQVTTVKFKNGATWTKIS
eukprot:TRINITY_DN9054_c1_g1_i1.p1 TRINITY_DN9054_c1_g1~~TRINITY_DN9054_c1_g1_i1.p1  ORF type:complete len:1293 (-),score=298.30 TRINITY_DN9054_c1_g1_i1:238-4116(-)